MDLVVNILLNSGWGEPIPQMYNGIGSTIEQTNINGEHLSLLGFGFDWFLFQFHLS